MKYTALATPKNKSEVIQRHQARVWRYLRFLGCDGALADDLTQETFLKFWEKPFQEYNESSTASFLQTTARNLYFIFLRKSKSAPQSLDFQPAESFWEKRLERDAGNAYIDALRSCIEILDGREKSILQLRYEEMSSRERMAALLKMNPEGIKTLLRRIKEQLKQCVEGKLKYESP